jgi:hypothetical protein
VPDRRFATLVAGGLLFATGLVTLALFARHHGHQELGMVDWDDGVAWLAGSCIFHMLVVSARVAGIGCLLMGHCYLLGIRVPAPVKSPLKWTNLAELWRGSDVYMYRFAYDGLYRQFFPQAEAAAAFTIAKITGLFLVIGCVHFVWGGPQRSWDALVQWAVLGVATGVTVIYLRHRSTVRMAKYLRDRRAPTRAWWSIALVPVCIAAVLAFRGLLDYGLVHADFAERLARMFGL